MATPPEILIIAGPTASGKSGLALSIAQKRAQQNINSVIINADSQQVYRELRIITARPTPQEEQQVPHRLYGALPATENCSAGKWLKLARMEIDWALGEGMQPIVVGGTGLYIKAMLEGIAAMPDIPAEVRQQAASDYEAMGKEAFAQRLGAVDPGFFNRLKVYDKQRLIRAYEVWLGSGRPLSWWQEQTRQPPYPPEYFNIYQIDIPRDALYARCDQRFRAMVGQGALEEVRHLLESGLSPDLPAMKSVGVRELGAYLRGEITLEQAIEDASQATRHYAKRQLTWFRHQLERNAAGIALTKIKSLFGIMNLPD